MFGECDRKVIVGEVVIEQQRTRELGVDEGEELIVSAVDKVGVELVESVPSCLMSGSWVEAFPSELLEQLRPFLTPSSTALILAVKS